jgi:two-component system chemotaxis sensor kinase CheA
MAPDPYKYFRVEARDLLDQFAKGILELEKNGIDHALMQRLLRLAHTLKGAARVVKQVEIAERSHAIEDVLSPLRDSTGAVARAQIDAVLAHLDEIGSRVSMLSPTVATERPAEGPSNRDDGGRGGPRTVRADVAEMDTVLDGIAETRTLLGGLRGAARELEQARHLADLLSAQLAPQRAANPGRNPRQLFAIAEELRRKFSGVDRSLASTIDQMDRELRQLHDGAEQLRLVSVDRLFTVLERTARDTAQALSKAVAFESSGGGIRLDADVIETVQGALIQLIRNAVAHGIEPPAERTAAAKPVAGRVIVDVARRGRRVAFACRDDGRGVDMEAVRRVALQRGLIEPNAKRASAEALIRTLLHGGISTSKTVTDVSGRGVGLDVVRAAVERLGGEVIVRTDSGAGTTFELLVPPSLTSMEALAVEVDGSGNVMAIPLDAVRNTLRVGAADISHTSSGASVLYEQVAIAFVPLSTVLDGTRWSANRSWSAIIVAAAEGLAAFGVERLLGTARIVVRALPEGLPVSAVVAGASLDSDGNPQLVLDPAGLVAAAQRGGAGSLEAVSPKRPLLVIDDSLTTRMLEQSILESAGYEVDVALSGEEALEIVRRKRYAVLLVDVEMPGMDGFSFIERIRSDPALRDIPAILVTSRAEPEDRQRGHQVGAQGYIGKGEFDQAELLTMIKSLIG